MTALLPHDDPARLDALRRLNVLDTPAESAFDDLTRLASALCGTPISLVTLLDTDRVWFKSHHGTHLCETPRGGAFCDHAVRQPHLFEVSDATTDERFAAHPMVTGDPHIRFYAGVPLKTPDGYLVGTLCVLDRFPRTLTADQRDALAALGRQAVAQLALRGQLAQQAKDYETFRVLFEQSSDAHLLFDECDGIIDCNHAAVAMLRLSSKEQVLALHPAVLSPEYQPCGRRSMEKCLEMDATARRNGSHRFDWTHRRADGEDFPCEVTLTPVELSGKSVLLVVWHDLTERKRMEDALRVSDERQRSQQAALLELIRSDLLGGEEVTWGVLEVITRTLEIDRASVWHHTPDRTAIRCVAMYEKEANWYSAGMTLPAVDYPDYFRALESDEVIAASAAATDPRTREFRDSYLLPLGISSMLDVPLRQAGRLSGVLCLEHVGSPRVWEADEQVFALGAANILALAAEQGERKRAEEALRASETRHKLALEGGDLGTWDWHIPSGRITINARWAEMLGYTPDEIEPHLGGWERLVHPDDVSDVMVVLTAHLEGRLALYSTEHRMRHKAGHWVWVLDRGRVIERDAAGMPVRACGTHLDVTDRKEVEQALLTSERRFRGAFDSAPIGMALVAPSGRWLKVNREVCDILGYEQDELLATDFQTLTHQDDLNADLELVQQILAGERSSYQMEKRYLHKSGRIVQALLAVALVRDETGHPLYFISHIKDITARKRAEADRNRAETELRQSEVQFRAAMEGSLDAVYFLAADRDANGTITDFRFTDLNQRGAALISRVREEVLGRRLCELLPINRTAGFFDKYVRVVETGEPLEEEFPITVDEVIAGWLHHQVVKVGDGVAITSQDVTARKRAEIGLRASEGQLRAIGDNLPDGLVYQYLITVDGQHFCPYISRGIERLTGRTAAEVMADAGLLFALIHPDDMPPLSAAIARSMNDLTEFDLETKYHHLNGQVRWMHIRSAPRRLSDGGTAWDGVMIDVTDRKRAEEELRRNERRLVESQQELERVNARLRRLAATDGLTGVNNRAAFDTRLKDEIERAVRYDRPLSMVMLDVDHFKLFNDTFGHPAGDVVLRTVAEQLAEAVRGADFLARYGGEEFAVVLPDTDFAGAMMVGERLRQAVADGPWDQRAITVSVGVATLGPDTTDADTLVQEADQALYRSKQAGRDRVHHGSNVISQMATIRR